MPQSLYYFAYGSNLHPVRLKARIPSSRFLTILSINGYSLHFHKRGQDGSAKCNLLPCSPSQSILGALFSMDAAEKLELDEIEGAGYRAEQWPVQFDGRDEQAFVYLAEPSHIEEGLQPFCWYKAFVALGAAFHGFPQAHLRPIDSVEAIVDPDDERRMRNESVLALMGSR